MYLEENKKKRNQKMRKIVIKYRAICLVVGFLLGLISAVLGIAAECTKTKVSQVHEVSPGVCSYPRSPASGLGMASAFALAVARTIINVIANSISPGCICCRRNRYTSTTHWTLALVCYIVSWLTFVVAYLLLGGGAVLNAEHQVRVQLGNNKSCFKFTSGLFVVAAVLSLVSVTFSILYFFITAHAEGVVSPFGDPTLPNEGGVAMGQP